MTDQMDGIRGQTIIPTGVRPPELVGLTKPKQNHFFPVLMAVLGAGVAIVVLLYAFGVFKAQLGDGQSIIIGRCLSTQTFLCNNPSLSHITGKLSFIFGQVTSTPIYSVSIACTAGTSVTNTTLNFTPLSQLGYTSQTLQNGVQIGINNETCYGANGAPLGSTPSGTVFTGTIWVLFKQTLQSTSQIVKAATISVAST